MRRCRLKLMINLLKLYYYLNSLSNIYILAQQFKISFFCVNIFFLSREERYHDSFVVLKTQKDEI